MGMSPCFVNCGNPMCRTGCNRADFANARELVEDAPSVSAGYEAWSREKLEEMARTLRRNLKEVEDELTRRR